MSIPSGSNDLPNTSPLDAFDFLLEDPSENLHEKSKNLGIENYNLFKGYFDQNNEDTLHVFSPNFSQETHSIKDLGKEGKLGLDPKKEFIINYKMNEKGDVIIETHEKIMKVIEKKKLILHSRGANGEEVVQDLRNRNVEYVGLNDAQYRKIFLVANQMFRSIAEEHAKTKEKQEDGSYNLFYKIHDFLPKANFNKNFKKLTSNIENLFFPKDPSILRSQHQSYVKEKRQKEAQEKSYEVRIESYKKDDMKREIRNDDIENNNLKAENRDEEEKRDS